MEPIELLQEELNKYMRAKRKSEDAYNLEMISRKEHETHIENLTPKIQEYKDAIQTLQIYGR